jgi:multimeric flavodoxin WrbA
MKIIAFNGSARPGGNTSQLLKIVLEEAETYGAETELVELAGQNISGCIACYQCFKNKDSKCACDKDNINDYIEKMINSDGIILASPTYFADVSANMKALIERCGMVSRANNDLYSRKIGASVVAVRRAGASHVFSSLNNFFLIGQMIIVGSSYWNIGIGKDIGDVQGDKEGIETMKTLGKNMSWLLDKVK